MTVMHSSGGKSLLRTENPELPKGTFTAQGWGSRHLSKYFLSSTRNVHQQMRESSATSTRGALNQPQLVTIKPWSLASYINTTYWKESSLTLHYHHWAGIFFFFFTKWENTDISFCSNWGFTNSSVKFTIRYCFLQQNHYIVPDTILRTY